MALLGRQHQERQDLDHMLVQFWTLHSIHLKVVHIHNKTLEKSFNEPVTGADQPSPKITIPLDCEGGGSVLNQDIGHFVAYVNQQVIDSRAT